MKLANYTTDVPVHKTLSEIQELLVKGGAQALLFDYDDKGQIKGLMFKLTLEGREMGYKLPANVDAVYNTMFKEKHGEWRYKDDRMEKSRRIAWRIIKDWLRAQMSIIHLHMVKPQEVFLPYMIIGNNQTLYEVMEQNQFALPSGKPEEGVVS